MNDDRSEVPIGEHEAAPLPFWTTEFRTTRTDRVSLKRRRRTTPMLQWRITSRIVGLRHHLQGSSNVKAQLNAVRQPGHAQDPNALAVVDQNDQVVGYLPASFAKVLSPLLDSQTLFLRSIALIEPLDNGDQISSSVAVEIAIDVAEKDLDDQLEMRIRDAAQGDANRSHFVESLNVSRVQNRHLMSNEDADAVERFLSLSGDCQSTLTRLLMRKSSWFAHDEDLNQNIEDLSDFLESSLVPPSIVADRKEWLFSLITALSVGELRKISTTLRLVKTGGKSELQRRLSDHFMSQRSINGSFAFENCGFLRKLTCQVAARSRLNQSHRQSLLRLYNLHTLDLKPLDQPLVLHAFSINAYVPRIRLLDATGPFASRQQMLDLEAAVDMSFLAQIALENQRWDDVIGFAALAVAAVSAICAPGYSCVSGRQLGDRILDDALDCYRAGSWYATIVYWGVKAYQRKQDWENAVSLLLLLLQQETMITNRRRGKLWQRLLLILDVHLKSKQLAWELCQEALLDSRLNSGGLIAVQDRALRLWKSNCNLDDQEDSPFPIISLTWSDYPVTKILARPTNRKTAEKSRFIGFNDEVCSVEELALQHYNLNGSWIGEHDEGRLIHHLFAVLLWDILWDESTNPRAFISLYQSAPLDLCSPSFYSLRRDCLESRFESIFSMDRAAFFNAIVSVYSTSFGKRCSGVSWEAWTPEQLADIAHCMGGPPIAFIFRLLAMENGDWGGGLPDLFLFNLERNEFQFVEVKGPNDRLSEQQRAWLARLHHAGFSVSVLKVSLPNGKLSRFDSKIGDDDV